VVGLPDVGGRHAELSPRHREIAGHLVRGLPLPEIALLMGIAHETARKHVRKMHERTDTRTLHGLSVWIVLHYDCCAALAPQRSNQR
jgi:DNA-binding CsgD family transcriptional regulator